MTSDVQIVNESVQEGVGVRGYRVVRTFEAIRLKLTETLFCNATYEELQRPTKFLFAPTKGTGLLQ
jgi:hypothetical protein